MKKLAVFFPGIGYTADKPLLYYSRKLAAEQGYEALTIPYGGFPKNAKGDEKKLRRCFALAKEQAEERLRDLRPEQYGEIVFVAKSIGTAAAAAVAAGSPGLARVRFVLYTPVEETFRFPLGEAVVFTGSADPWVGGGDSRIPALCAERNIPCTLIPGANHSLETGEVGEDLRNLTLVMEQTAAFLNVQGRRSF